MTEEKRNYFRFVEVADHIYAAISPAEPLDITDAGLMDNFSNAGLVLRGGGLVCDTCFTLPQAEELKAFCTETLGHPPETVVNTHGHWDHYWGNQVFAGARVLGHRGVMKDCAGDKNKLPVFKLLHGSKLVQGLLNRVMGGQFKGWLPAGQPFRMVVRQGEKDFDLTGVTPTPPAELFEEKTVLQLGDTRAELIPLGAVHSSSDTIVWLPNERVLFAGDIFADCSLPMSMAAARRWLEVLDYILDELRPLAIVPGHGEVYDAARAESQRAYFRALVDRFEQYYTDTIPEQQLLEKMNLGEFIDHRPRLAWVMAAKALFKERRSAAKAKG